MTRPASPPVSAEPAVVRAGFSPIKGTRHLALPSVDLDSTGVVGDRRFCFVDPVARRVLPTVQHPTLPLVTAREREGVLSLSLPDGRSVATVPVPSGVEAVCDYWGRPVTLSLLTGPHAALISSYLGRDVALAAAPPQAVIYGAPVTIITRTSLDDLAARWGPDTSERVDPARFRATFVLDSPEPAGAEDNWTGRELRVGSAVIRIGTPIGRCAVINSDPHGGQRDSALLRTLASYRPRNGAGEPCFGMHAEVVVPGHVSVEEFGSESEWA